jgi:RNA polymerase sigma-70 factor (ECF subfamily)
VADADDAAQEVFVVGLSKLEQIEAGRERAFLYGCALNKAAQFRSARTREHEELDTELVDTRWISAEELLDRKQAQAVLDRVLDRLSDEQRVVFVLYEIEELTLSEIAELLRIPSGTVASRLRLARARVQNQVMMLGLAANQSSERGASEPDSSFLPTLGERTP